VLALLAKRSADHRTNHTSRLVADLRKVGARPVRVEAPDLPIPKTPGLKPQTADEYEQTLIRVKQLDIRFHPSLPKEQIANFQGELAHMPTTVKRIELLQHPGKTGQKPWTIQVEDKPEIGGRAFGDERRIEINTGSFIAREPFFATSTLAHETSHALQHELPSFAFADYRSDAKTLEHSIRNNLAEGSVNEGKATLDQYLAFSEYLTNSGKQPPTLPFVVAERALVVPVVRDYLSGKVSRDEAIRLAGHAHFYGRRDFDAERVDLEAGGNSTAKTMEDLAILQGGETFDAKRPDQINEKALGGAEALVDFTAGLPRLKADPHSTLEANTWAQDRFLGYRDGTPLPLRDGKASNPCWGTGPSAMSATREPGWSGIRATRSCSRP
jgi:hypothetical protein